MFGVCLQDNHAEDDGSCAQFTLPRTPEAKGIASALLFFVLVLVVVVVVVVVLVVGVCGLPSGYVRCHGHPGAEPEDCEEDIEECEGVCVSEASGPGPDGYTDEVDQGRDGEPALREVRTA